MQDKQSTEKLHILAVLEKGLPMNAIEIRYRLRKGFDLEPLLNTLRKNLKRCFDQGIVDRDKMMESYDYRITEKGLERLRRIRASRETRVRRRTKLLRLPSVSGVFDSRMLLKRLFEIVYCVKLCDVVLNKPWTGTASEFATVQRTYWERQLSELTPYISGHVVKMAEQISKDFARRLDQMLAPFRY